MLFFFLRGEGRVSGEHIKSKRSHSIILFSHRIFSSEETTGPLPLPDWGLPLRKGISHHFVEPLHQFYLHVVLLHSASSPDVESHLCIKVPSSAKTKLLSTTLLLTLCIKMLGYGQTIFLWWGPRSRLSPLQHSNLAYQQAKWQTKLPCNLCPRRALRFVTSPLEVQVMEEGKGRKTEWQEKDMLNKGSKTKYQKG